eukprot:gene4344-5073_t
MTSSTEPTTAYLFVDGTSYFMTRYSRIRSSPLLSYQVGVTYSTSHHLYSDPTLWWLRQAQQLKISTIPSTLEAYNITTQEQFEKSQAYGREKLYYYNFVLEERNGFNKITRGLFIKDKIVGVLLAMAIGSPIIFMLISVIKWTGPLFWIYAWALMFVISLVMLTIYPILIAPLFNTYSPVEGELKDDIMALAKRVDFPATKMFVVDNSKRSGHMNAYFYGFFKNKRIVLYDTLVKELSKAEILAVLCHEFGHYKMNHTIKLMAFQQVYLLVFFYTFGHFMNDVQLFTDFSFQEPNILIGLILFSSIYAPLDQIFSFIVNIFSRKFEYEADDYAFHFGYDLTDGLVKLYIHDHASLLVDPLYSAFHYTHPTLLERLNNIKMLTASKKVQ